MEVTTEKTARTGYAWVQVADHWEFRLATADPDFSPKTVINGLAIWDVRHRDKNAGWYVRCGCESHQSCAEYFYRLDDAKDFCKNTDAMVQCAECVVESALAAVAHS